LCWPAVKPAFGDSIYIMETGFRERQGAEPFSQQIMRFEPRRPDAKNGKPVLLQADAEINKDGRRR
jgi:hypothetical protein